MFRLLPLLVTALIATACGDGQSSKAAPPEREITRLDLGDIVLQQDEAPEGTAFLAARSGLLQLNDLWPDDCCPGQQILFDEAGFETAYAGVFEKPGYSGEPIDTRPGYELVSSAAVLFETPVGASSGLGAWLDYYESPVLDRLPDEGLGEDAIGLMGSPNAPAEVLFLYLWRVDSALFSVRVSAGAGTVSAEDVRALVDRMNARIP